jgi:hypothetical protein
LDNVSSRFRLPAWYSGFDDIFEWCSIQMQYTNKKSEAAEVINTLQTKAAHVAELADALDSGSSE